MKPLQCLSAQTPANRFRWSVYLIVMSSFFLGVWLLYFWGDTDFVTTVVASSIFGSFITILLYVLSRRPVPPFVTGVCCLMWAYDAWWMSSNPEFTKAQSGSLWLKVVAVLAVLEALRHFRKHLTSRSLPQTPPSSPPEKS